MLLPTCTSPTSLTAARTLHMTMAAGVLWRSVTAIPAVWCVYRYLGWVHPVQWTDQDQTSTLYFLWRKRGTLAHAPQSGDLVRWQHPDAEHPQLPSAAENSAAAPAITNMLCVGTGPSDGMIISRSGAMQFIRPGFTWLERYAGTEPAVRDSEQLGAAPIGSLDGIAKVCVWPPSKWGTHWWRDEAVDQLRERAQGMWSRRR